MRRMQKFILPILLGLLLAGAGLAHAASGGGGVVVSYSVDCTHITLTYTTISFNRDNTGAGKEAYTAIITDGAGNTLTAVSVLQPIGTTLPAGTDSLAFGTPPAANPIRLYMYSHAGNGLSQQTILDVSGSSPCLPSAQCDAGAPAGSVLSTLPDETPAYYDADFDTATGFNIPAGSWFTYEVSGEFTHLWVTCGANPVWVRTSALR